VRPAAHTWRTRTPVSIAANRLAYAALCWVRPRDVEGVSGTGSVTTPSSQNSSIGIIGRRYYGDLTQFQNIAQL